MDFAIAAEVDPLIVHAAPQRVLRLFFKCLEDRIIVVVDVGLVVVEAALLGVALVPVRAFAAVPRVKRTKLSRSKERFQQFLPVPCSK